MEYKIQNVPIEKIYKSDKNKEGNPYMSAKGNPFKKVDIYIDPRAIEDTSFDGKITYFDYFDNSERWEVGVPISGTITTNEANGRIYYNYAPPSTGKKALELDLKQLEDRIKKLEDKVFGIEGKSEEVNQALDMSKEMLKDDEEITMDDLPF